MLSQYLSFTTLHVAEMNLLVILTPNEFGDKAVVQKYNSASDVTDFKHWRTQSRTIYVDI